MCGNPYPSPDTHCRALQVPVFGHIVCGGCNIMLMYPVGAQSVKCSVCHTVTQASATPPSLANPGGGGGGGGGRGGGSGQPSRQPAPAKPNQTVVVENPPTLDDQGHEVSPLLAHSPSHHL